MAKKKEKEPTWFGFAEASADGNVGGWGQAMFYSGSAEDILKRTAIHGGTASGVNRLKEAGDWRNKALECAKLIRSEELTRPEKPQLPKAALATEIAFKLDIKRGQSMLIPLIRQWERDGKLPRKLPRRKM
ncbi:MAG: hypothetical protein WCC90_08150 [Methylocella sp.]